MENKVDRSVVHSKENLWLEVQKVWEKISVKDLRKRSDTIEKRAAVTAVESQQTK